MHPDKRVKDFVEALIWNKTFEDAKCELIKRKLNIIIRPVMIDGAVQMVTMDYRLDRVNIEIDNGIIRMVINWG